MLDFGDQGNEGKEQDGQRISTIVGTLDYPWGKNYYSYFTYTKTKYSRQIVA